MNIEDDTQSMGGPNSDQAYTGGYRFSYMATDNEIPLWIKLSSIPHPDHIDPISPEARVISGISLSQQLFTPDDVYTTTPIANDRPYAAWLYLGFSSYFQTESESDSLEFDMGLIGPEAEGQPLQNGIHEVLGDRHAAGWANQLSTEPTLQLFYQKRLKYFSLNAAGKGKYMDIIPYYGAALGNVAINAHFGGLIRYGWGNLPDDFGPTRASSEDGNSFVPKTSSGSRSNFYLFAGGRIIAVARNIFLDGNTFRDSPRVSKYTLMGESDIGFAKQFQSWNIAWHFVTRSPEFAEKSAFNSFASLSVVYDY